MARDTSFGQYLRFGQCVRLADGASRRPVCPAARQQRPSSQPELLAPSHVCPARGTQGRPGPAQAPAPWKAAGAGGGGGTGGGCAWGVCARGRARLGGWGGSARAGVPEGDPPPRPRPRARHRTSLSLVSRLPSRLLCPRAAPGASGRLAGKGGEAAPRAAPPPATAPRHGGAGPRGVAPGASRLTPHPPHRGSPTHLVRRQDDEGAVRASGRGQRENAAPSAAAAPAGRPPTAPGA